MTIFPGSIYGSMGRLGVGKQTSAAAGGALLVIAAGYALLTPTAWERNPYRIEPL